MDQLERNIIDDEHQYFIKYLKHHPVLLRSNDKILTIILNVQKSLLKDYTENKINLNTLILRYLKFCKEESKLYEDINKIKKSASDEIENIILRYTEFNNNNHGL